MNTIAAISPSRYQARAPQSAGLLEFFAHHGIWAPGVRLFRKVNFTTKALLVSLAFLVPIVLLMGAYLKTVQESIDFASNERAGVTLLRAVEPWQIEVQKQRRLVISGFSATVDMPAIEARLVAITQQVAARPRGLDALAALDKAAKSHKELLAAVQGGNDAAHTAEPLQAYVDAIREFRNTVLDLSALSLDPEQATYYVMSVAAIVSPDVIESVSRSRALAGASARSEQSVSQSRLLFAIWYLRARSFRARRTHLGTGCLRAAPPP